VTYLEVLPVITAIKHDVRRGCAPVKELNIIAESNCISLGIRACAWKETIIIDLREHHFGMALYGGVPYLEHGKIIDG